MDEVINENIKSDVLPYDFVKENNVIASKTKNGYLVTSPRKLKNLIKKFKDILTQVLNLNFVILESLMKF